MIKGPNPSLWGAAPGVKYAHDLPLRVDARIGPACADYATAQPRESLDCLLQRPLHCGHVLLPLEPVIPRPIILSDKDDSLNATLGNRIGPRGQTSSNLTNSAPSPWRGPNFVILV